MIVAGLLLMVLVPMILEARVAARHDHALRELGAVEPAGDVYSVMRIAYPLGFVAMAGEGWARRSGIDGVFVAGVGVFVIAKALKYWAITALGERWTFRVLVPPQSTRVSDGPYRVVRHPNYIAVVGELIGTALMAHALITGVGVTFGFCLLILARIRVEERALGETPE